jgi:hypothetical protein
MQETKSATIFPSGQLIESDLEKLTEFTAAGHREIAPLYVKEADTGLLGILGAQGFYRMGVHADGRPVVLFAADPADLDPTEPRDPAFRARYAPGYYLDPERVGRIDVVAARRRRTHKKWVAEAVNRHGYFVNDSKLEFGFLYRLNQRTWVSGAIAYTLEEAKKRKGEPERSEPLYRVRCYTTPGRAQPFGNITEEQLRTRYGRVLSWGKSAQPMTISEAEAAIREDFAKRVDLVMRNKDPNLLGRLKNEPDAESPLSPYAANMLARSRGAAINAVVRVVGAAAEQIKSIRAQALLVGVTRTALLSTVQFLFKGWRATVGQIILGTISPVMNSIKRTQALMANSRLEDIGYSFWKPGRSAIAGSSYCRIDPQQAMLIRFLGYDEAKVRPLEGTSLRAHMRPDWAEENIIDTLDAPSGTIVEKIHIGGGEVLHTVEPNGLQVYYLVGRDIAYAVAPQAETPEVGRMADSIRKLVAEKGPVIRVCQEAHGLASKAVRPQEFLLEMEADLAAGSSISAVPPLVYDMNLLRDYAKALEAERTMPPAKRALRLAFMAAARAGEKLHMHKPELPSPEMLSRQELARKLADRKPAGPR